MDIGERRAYLDLLGERIDEENRALDNLNQELLKKI